MRKLVQKTLAAVLSCALMVTMMGAPAKAAVSNANEDKDKYFIDAVAALPEGCAITDVYGASFEVETTFDEATGMGGGLVFASDSGGWNQLEWGNTEKAIVFDGAKLSASYVSETPLFKATDEWAKVYVCHWGWGADIKVKAITLLGKDGKALAATETNKGETDKEETDKEVTVTPDNDKQTGDMDLTFVYVALVACMGGLVVVNLRKKQA